MTIAVTRYYCEDDEECSVLVDVALNVRTGHHYYLGALGFHSMLARFSYGERGALVVTVSPNPVSPLLVPIFRNGIRLTTPDPAELEINAGGPVTFRFRASSLPSGGRVEWAIGGAWRDCVEMEGHDGVKKLQVTQLQVVIKRETSLSSVSCP